MALPATPRKKVVTRLLGVCWLSPANRSPTKFYIKQLPELALCRTKEEIEEAYTKAWNKYSLSYMKKYCEKMPELMKKVVETKGYECK